MKSIANRLMVYFGGLILIICLVLGVLGTHLAYTNAVNSMTHQLLDRATDSSRLLTRDVQANLQLLKTISNYDAITSMNWEMQLPVLKQQLAEQNFSHLGIADTEGNLLYADGSTVKISDRDYYIKAMSGQTYLSEPEWNDIIEDMVIYAAAPIQKANKTEGVLLGVYKAEKLWQIIDEIKIGQTGYVFVIDAQGTTIAHPVREL